MLLGSAIWFIPPITARLLFPEQVMAFDLSKPAEASRRYYYGHHELYGYGPQYECRNYH